MNTLGQIIDVKKILEKHNGESGCGTNAKICEYLGCEIGDEYICFNDMDEPYKGTLCKIKKDVFLNYTMSAFNGNHDGYSEAYKDDTVGGNGNNIVYLGNYNYIMRLK